MDNEIKLNFFGYALVLLWIVMVISLYLFLYGSPEINSFISRLGYDDTLFYLRIDIMKFFHG